MRVLVACDHWFPDHRGGAARVAAETADRFARAGVDVDALVPELAGESALERSGRLAVYRVLSRSALPHTLTDPVATFRAARMRTADVTLAHTSTTAVGLHRALPHCPLVVVYHASAAREAAFERSRAVGARRRAALGALGPPLRLLEALSLQRASRVLVLSEFSRSLLETDHPEVLDRTVCVGGGVDTRAFTPGDRAAARARVGVDPAASLLLAVRRLEPRMGHELLLEAFAGLRERRPLLRLALVGDGSLLDALRRRCRALRLDDAVVFAGRVPEESLFDWYRAADLAVVPTVAYEGFGLATAEALACGVPVVGTPVGATPELLGPLEPRLLSDRATARSLAAALERGLELASAPFARRCRAYAEHALSWDAVFPAWEAAVADALYLRPASSAASRRVPPAAADLRSVR